MKERSQKKKKRTVKVSKKDRTRRRPQNLALAPLSYAWVGAGGPERQAPNRASTAVGPVPTTFDAACLLAFADYSPAVPIIRDHMTTGSSCMFLKNHCPTRVMMARELC